MAENPPLSVETEQHRTQLEIAAAPRGHPLPSLWTHLEQHKQKQMAQLVAELIRRTRRQPLNWEEREHEQ